MKELEQLALEKSSQELAAFTHGAMFGLHTLGAYFNLRRKNYSFALLHSAIALYDLASLYHHSKYVSQDDLVERLREAGL